mmetsp:Transcript_804/g.1347  ORF Transcript_804/g.1347 Transcript_804/m.1347 type:complete len:161 (-) Transcript_804:123-605(-)
MPKCIAKYPYNGPEAEGQFLSFDQGDILSSVILLDGGWWFGEDSEGCKGYFPSSYVTLVSSNDSNESKHFFPEDEDNGQETSSTVAASSTETQSNDTPSSETATDTLHEDMVKLDVKDSAEEGQVPRDITGWLRLKDDVSGKFFYFSKGEYSWGTESVTA